MFEKIWEFICKIFGFYSKPKFKTQNNIKWEEEENELFNLVNQYRLDNNLSHLLKDDSFYNLSELRNLKNINLGYITHDGLGKIGQILADLNIFNYGENLAYGIPNPDVAFLAWKHSKKGHKETMLNKGWKYTGVSIIEDERGVKYYCQLFGY